MVLLILNFGSLLSVGYEKVYLLQNDTNLSASEVISTYVYKVGLQQADFSFSAATDVFNSVGNTCILLLANGMSKWLTKTSLFGRAKGGMAIMAQGVQVNKKPRLGTRMTMGDKVFVTVVYVILAVLMISMLYPMIFVLSASFSDPRMVSTGKMLLWPVGVRLDGYKYILQYQEIWTGYLNTLLYTIVGTLVNLGVTLPCAYALSRRDMKGRAVIMTVFMITMYVNGGMIAGYLNVKSFNLLDNRAFIIINGAVSVYNLIVARTFFATTIPIELQEAARIDGCNDFGILLRLSLIHSWTR